MHGEYKHYGLTNRRIRAKIINPSVCDYDAAQGAPNPWAYGEQVAIVKHESPYCLTVEIQPHRNPHGWGESVPYCTSIHKHDLYTGKVIIRNMDGEIIPPGKRKQIQPTQSGHRWHHHKEMPQPVAADRGRNKKI